MAGKRKGRILIVDDENGIRQALKMVLQEDNEVILAASGAEAVDAFTQNAFDIVLLDILLPDSNGLDLLKTFKETDPNTAVVMVTAVKEIKTAVQAIKAGAYEYIIKPFVVDDLLAVIDRAQEKKKLLQQVSYLKHELQRYHLFEKMIGKDPKMTEVFDLIATVASSDGAVLIQGESGTGKELVARAIHHLSSRKDQPFVVINCAAIPASLMESEIFGHQKGAFTGAVSSVMGKFEVADGGTVFLDDIDCLEVSMQAKLLRVIQEKEFERVGSHKVLKADIRFVAACNKEMQALIQEGRFREDLFYRLNVFPIKLPPLRERRIDIPLLLEHFLGCHAQHTGKPAKRFSDEALAQLTAYQWPGNVRELQNLVERLFTITKSDIIGTGNLFGLSIAAKQLHDMTLREAVNDFEKDFITQVLARVRGNRKKAAEILGVHRNTLLAKINDLGIEA
ncbi:Acetoacetate metabolism regulatory protein AtoC [uncultured Desulfatiglans sp.]|uniref:DNA-binding transcriptional regulator NtrC n=1 Tax=Uncultured Desulfatiglans sp. TaxID=1748965 RepID=A0A653A2A0_UNCDX|nr:Acetoacetate metabolism regulatory protein AtoC [uncultured Desulfatiglans sp.]